MCEKKNKGDFLQNRIPDLERQVGTRYKDESKSKQSLMVGWLSSIIYIKVAQYDYYVKFCLGPSPTLRENKAKKYIQAHAMQKMLYRLVNTNA